MPLLSMNLAGAFRGGAVANFGTALSNAGANGTLSSAVGGIVFVYSDAEPADTDSSNASNLAQVSQEAQGFTNVFVVQGGIRLPDDAAALDEESKDENKGL